MRALLLFLGAAILVGCDQLTSGEVEVRYEILAERQFVNRTAFNIAYVDAAGAPVILSSPEASAPSGEIPLPWSETMLTSRTDTVGVAACGAWVKLARVYVDGDLKSSMLSERIGPISCAWASHSLN